MEKNFNFRALALVFAATFAVSPLNAGEQSFFVKHKTAIIVGTTFVITAAGLGYYFKDNLLEIARNLLKEKEVSKAGRSAESFKKYQDDYDKALGNQDKKKDESSKVEDKKAEAPKVEEQKVPVQNVEKIEAPVKEVAPVQNNEAPQVEDKK